MREVTQTAAHRLRNRIQLTGRNRNEGPLRQRRAMPDLNPVNRLRQLINLRTSSAS